jgi:hypothetical protein
LVAQRLPSLGRWAGQTPQLQPVPTIESLHVHVTAPYVQLIVARFGSCSHGSDGRGCVAGQAVQLQVPFSQAQVWFA